MCLFPSVSQRWGTRDAEIEVTSAENPESTQVFSVQAWNSQNVAMHTSPRAENAALFISTFLIHSTETELREILSSKIQLMRSLVTSIFLYVCESWTLTAEL